MSNFLLACLVGIASTSLMTFALYLLHWRGFSNGDMVRALGSILTRHYENALGPGLALHYTFGVLFTFLYVYVWGLFPEIAADGIWRYVGLGIFCGAAQGLVVSMLLVIFVAEHHPLLQFRVAGMRVALAHVLAHVVFGGVVGLMVGAMKLTL